MNLNEVGDYVAPTFQEPMKGYVLDLINSMPKVVKQVAQKGNQVEDIAEVEEFRSTFYKCFVLTKNRVEDIELKSRINKWLMPEDLTNKEKRKDTVSVGLQLQESFLDELDNVGTIDFTGRENKHFPFFKIIQDHKDFKNGETISEEHKYLIATLFKSNLRKDILKEISKIVSKIESDGIQISKVDMEMMIKEAIESAINQDILDAYYEIKYVPQETITLEGDFDD